MKKRLDLILVERGLFETREKAKREIMVGNIIVNEQAVTKAGTNFKDDEKLNIRIKNKLRYVSRGGLKLEKAIKEWELDFNDKLVLDIGASTGGFTDCALQNGAKRVYSVDVGTNQLDWKLRNDDRVVSIEETHIKDLTPENIENNKVDYIVIDVSFISLTKVIPYFEKFLKENDDIHYEYDALLGAGIIDIREESGFQLKKYDSKSKTVYLKDKYEEDFVVDGRKGHQGGTEITLKLVKQNGKWLIDDSK